MFSKNMRNYFNEIFKIFTFKFDKTLYSGFKPIILEDNFNSKEIANQLEKYVFKFDSSKNQIDKIISRLYSIDPIKDKDNVIHFYQIYYTTLHSFLRFFYNNSIIYKFNNKFLIDYMNYELNFDDLVLKNKIYLKEDNFIIYADECFESLESTHKWFNLVLISKFEDFSKSQKFINFSLRTIDNPSYFINIVRRVDEKFDLIDSYVNKRLNNKITSSYEISYTEYEDSIIKKIIKLMLYIQSSNVDLRKITPVTSQNENRKERDRSMQSNFKNDSVIPYWGCKR